MDIYENIIVGNFLYGLGVQIGLRHTDQSTESMCINLLQQTPLDERLGDIFIANACIYRLIEFKRTANRSKKETLKRRMIEDALSEPETEYLKKISRKIHWYIESDNRKKHWVTKSIPYIDFLKPEDYVTMEDFMSITAKEATSSSMSIEEIALCKAYISLVANLVPDGDPSSGGLLLIVTGTGQMQYVVVDDIRELMMPAGKVLEIYNEQDRHVRMSEVSSEIDISDGYELER